MNKNFYFLPIKFQFVIEVSKITLFILIIVHFQSFSNFFRHQANVHGLTGHIEFNEGKRSNFKIDLLKLKREQIQKVGHWSPADGINVTDPTAFYETNATNITLIVMTREVSLTRRWDAGGMGWGGWGSIASYNVYLSCRDRVYGIVGASASNMAGKILQSSPYTKRKI